MGQALIRNLYASTKKLLGQETNILTGAEAGILLWRYFVFQFWVVFLEVKGLVALKTADKEGLAQIGIVFLNHLPSNKDQLWKKPCPSTDLFA
jgi:hypothetical protein